MAKVLNKILKMEYGNWIAMNVYGYCKVVQHEPISEDFSHINFDC